MKTSKKQNKLKKKLCKQCTFGVNVGKKAYCVLDVEKICKNFSKKEK